MKSGLSSLLVALMLASTAWAGEWPAATVYKSPNCGCCSEYVSYLQSHGLTVDTVSTDNLSGLNRRYGVPQTHAGCHTTVIGDYVVGGHVPINVLERLLTERPDVTGITLPGMPPGSPGMTGTKQRPFEIYQFRAGEPEVSIFAVE